MPIRYLICPNCDNGDPTNPEIRAIQQLVRFLSEDHRMAPEDHRVIVFHCHACGHESDADSEQWEHFIEE